MAVLSHKEYKKSQVNRTPATFVEEKSLPEYVKVPEVLFRFLHPENGVSDYINETSTIIIDNVEYEKRIQNGVLETKDKAVADFYIKKNWPLMSKEEI